jgi:hypothetical protein
MIRSRPCSRMRSILKSAYADLALRPLLIALMNGVGTGTTTVVSQPATTQPTLGPTLTGFLPPSAAVGASVTLSGTGFTKVTAVLFSSTPASFQVVNATTIVAVVPVGATTGPVAVITAAGTGTSTASFTVSAATTTPVATKATAPSFGQIDDINNTVPINNAYSFSEVRWSIEGQGPQVLASNSICSPGNFAGRLFAYVVADSAAGRLQSDKFSQASSRLLLAPTMHPVLRLAL